MSLNRNALGRRIRRRRKELHLTQDEVPGFSRSAIAMYESGRRVPPRKKLEDLSRSLAIPLEELSDALVPHSGQNFRTAAEEAYYSGRYREAFRTARQYWQWATDTHDPLEISQASALLERIARHLSPEQFLFDEFQALPYESLTGLSHWARSNDHWELALMISEWLIRSLKDTNSDEYWKAVRNRSRICIDMGHFQQAIFWYDRALLQKDMAFDLRLRARASRLVPMAFEHRMDHNERQDLLRHTQRNPLVWQIYWWAVTHYYWWTEDWDSLQQAYDQSLAFYPPDWAKGYQLLLLGIKAALEWHHQHSLATMERLHHALRSDRVDTLAGSDISQDLWHDWLILSRDTNAPDWEVDWSSYILLLVGSQRIGLAQWFSDRMPARPNDALPLSLSIQLKRFRERSRPWNDPVMENWE
ncbi:MAG: helix-turn-helix transcriptional regulator [Firmicutes bacterium]|nr:helix-turn-helix transcriptional regulator [Bacillota bacterium]